MTPNCAAVRLQRVDYQSRLATRQRARYHCTVCIILSVKSVYLVYTETYVIYVAFIYDPLHCIYVRFTGFIQARVCEYTPRSE